MVMKFRSINICLFWPLSLFLLGVADFSTPKNASAPSDEISIPRRATIPKKRTNVLQHKPAQVQPRRLTHLPVNREAQHPAPEVLKVERLVSKKQPPTLTGPLHLASSALNDVFISNTPPTIPTQRDTEANFLGEIAIGESPGRSPSQKSTLALNHP